jgi:hypothetical protein
VLTTVEHLCQIDSGKLTEGTVVGGAFANMLAVGVFSHVRDQTVAVYMDHCIRLRAVS